MNDFTKEELEQLISWGEIYTEFGQSWIDALNRPLIEKIQSMIDNYCEHTWFVYIDSDKRVLRCHKCDKEIT
jgi:hypothetical protein